jgi:excisionase family DNA binding protein
VNSEHRSPASPGDLSEYSLRVDDVAETLKVSGYTVRRWITDGRLPAYRIPNTRPYLIRPADVQCLLDEPDSDTPAQPSQTSKPAADFNPAEQLLF